MLLQMARTKASATDTQAAVETQKRVGRVNKVMSTEAHKRSPKLSVTKKYITAPRKIKATRV